MKDYEKVNEVYTHFFKAAKNSPARSAYAVSALPMGAKVMMEVVAVVGDVEDQDAPLIAPDGRWKNVSQFHMG